MNAHFGDFQKSVQSRIGQACERCRSQKRRCTGDTPCKECRDRSKDCKYNVVRKAQKHRIDFLVRQISQLREDVTAIKQQTVHNSETDGDSETDGGSEYMHIRKIILRTTMQGIQTCLSIKIPMPRCLILPKTTALSLALEQLIDLVGGRQCEEEFRKSLYQLSSWTAALWKTMDYSELKKSLGELVQRCKKLLVRNLPTSSSSTTLATSSPSTSTTRGDNAIDSESDEDTAAAPEMNRTSIGVPASTTNMDQPYGIFPSEQTVKVSTSPFQHGQQNNSEWDSHVAMALAPRVEFSVDAQWFSEVQ